MIRQFLDWIFKTLKPIIFSTHIAICAFLIELWPQSFKVQQLLWPNTLVILHQPDKIF